METFTIADSSTKPYAHMVENIDTQDIEDANKFVEDWARTAINATNYGDRTDDEIYQEWRETGNGEYEAAVKYIRAWMKEGAE